MAEEYLSTDPNAGLEDSGYLSTDPNAGLEQKPEGGVGAGVLSAVGHALNPINIVKGALGLGQPSDISQIMRYGKTLGEIVSGTSPDEAIGRNIPELQHEREAFYGKLGTKEQAQEMAGLGIQAALLAAPFIHGKVLPRAPGSLSEVAGIKPVTPEAMPQTPEPLVSEVAAQEAPIIPQRESIAFASVKKPNGEVVTGINHADAAEKAGGIENLEHGFTTSNGRFLTPDQAYDLADKGMPVTTPEITAMEERLSKLDEPIEEVIPSATEIRQEPESSIIEHPPVEEGALPAETSSSNRPVQSGEIKGQEVDQISKILDAADAGENISGVSLIRERGPTSTVDAFESLAAMGGNKAALKSFADAGVPIPVEIDLKLPSSDLNYYRDLTKPKSPLEQANQLASEGKRFVVRYRKSDNKMEVFDTVNQTVELERTSRKAAEASAAKMNEYSLKDETYRPVKPTEPVPQPEQPIKPIHKMTREEYGDEVAKGNILDSIYRYGEPRTKHPFYATDIMYADILGSSGELTGQHGIQPKNPLKVESMPEASEKLFGKNIYPSGPKAKIGEVSEKSKAILEADNKIGDAAEKAGYDAIVTPREVQIIDKSLLHEPEPTTFNEQQGYYEQRGEPLPEGIGYDYAIERSKTKKPAPVPVAPTTAESVPKTEEVISPTEPPPVPTESTGIAQRYREDELGEGSVIPGVGKTPTEARDWGQDFINKGGNPYDLVNQKGPKRELWQEVGGVRAEYDRLGIEKRKAEAALEANPDDSMAQMAFDNADAAQRQWSKDMQPVLTRAGDALRAASRAYPREINSFSDFTDILYDHFGGEVELTPAKRAEIQKLVKTAKQVNGEADLARQQVTEAAVKRANGKVLPFEELKADIRGTFEQLLKDCGV